MALLKNDFARKVLLRSLIGALGCSMILGIATPALAQDPLTRFLDSIFKKNQQPAAPQAAPQFAPRTVVKPRPPRPVQTQTRQVPKRPQPATVIVRDAQQKHEANTYIAVIGDLLGEALVGGLREAFAANNDIAIVNRSSSKTNLTRADAKEWTYLTRDYTRDNLPNTQPITLGVVFIGADEQLDLLDTDGTLATIGSPRWLALMAQRVDTLIRTFADRRIPLVWVGLPPMKPEGQSTTASALNALYRDEVLKAGGAFVDIWAGFSNDEKSFISTGPDVKGKEARLRTPDGIGLTPSGARKVAYFAELEIRRLLQARGLSTVIAITTPEPIVTVEKNNTILSLPDVPVPVIIPVKPVFGPILPLLSIRPDPNGKLIQSRPTLKGDAALIAYRVYGEGRMPEPVPGRVDDFSWPTHSWEQQALPTHEEVQSPQKTSADSASKPL